MAVSSFCISMEEKKNAVHSLYCWKSQIRENSNGSKIQNSGFSPKEMNHLSTLLSLSKHQFTHLENKRAGHQDLYDPTRLENLTHQRSSDNPKNPFNWYQVTLLPLVKKVKQLVSSWMAHSKLKGNKLFSSVMELWAQTENQLCAALTFLDVSRSVCLRFS